MADEDRCKDGHDMVTDWVDNNQAEGTTTIHRKCRRCPYTDTQGPFRA